MKKTLPIYIICTFICASCFAQPYKDTSIKIDVLKSPSSTAFSFLNIASTDIQRPTDASSFALALQNSTNNFTTIPTKFGFEVAPCIIGKNTQSLSDYFDKKATTFKQTFVVSFGFLSNDGKSSNDTIPATKVSAGVKFSIIRPKIVEKQKQIYDSIYKYMRSLSNMFEALDSPTIAEHVLRNYFDELSVRPNKTKAALDSLELIMNALVELRNKRYLSMNKVMAKSDNAKKLEGFVSKFKIQRVGWFLDFNSGLATDFQDNKINQGKIYRAGAWLSGGYINDEKNISLLAIARYLYNPKNIFADDAGLLKKETVSTFDAGARILANFLDGKLTFGSEAIYRSVLKKASVLKPSWRWGVTAEYAVFNNTKLAFSFGRDFDGAYVKGGNVFSALNFIFGFGNEKEVGTPKKQQ